MRIEVVLKKTSEKDIEDGIIEIPEGVETIGRYAFDGLKGVEKIIFPSTLKKVDNYAVDDCSKLREVEFRSGDFFVSSETTPFQIFHCCPKLSKILLAPAHGNIDESTFMLASQISKLMTKINNKPCDLSIREPKTNENTL